MKSDKSSGLFILIFVVAASFALSYGLQPRNAPKIGQVPVNDYFSVVSSEEETFRETGTSRTEFYSLTVCGEFIGFFRTADEAVVFVENAAYRQVNEEYEEYENYDIISGFSIEKVIMAENEFENSEKKNVPVLDINVYVLESKKVSVPFSTTYKDNSNEYIGTEKVKSGGTDGVNEETYRLTYLHGELTNSEKIGEKVITNPVNRVIERGTKYKKETQIFVFPYDGRITAQYGGRYLMGYTSHRGIDLAGLDHEKYNATGIVVRAECYGENIHAAGSGKVVFAGFNVSYGYYVVIEHSNKLRTYYAHQSKILVSVGDYVNQGDVIGRIGSTGNSSAPHVHFEIRTPGPYGEYTDSVDPADYLIGYDDYPLDD